MVDVQRFDPSDVVRSMGLDINMPAVGYCAMEDGEPIAIFGLAWGAGKCWLWFKVDKLQTKHRFKVWRQTERLKRLAVQMGHDAVYVVRDPAWQTSEKLIKLMGFEPVETIDGQEIHVCKLKGSEE